jgi:hypothetical protein
MVDKDSSSYYKHLFNHFITDLIAGSFCGTAICIVGHPFDTLKVRM